MVELKVTFGWKKKKNIRCLQSQIEQAVGFIYNFYFRLIKKLSSSIYFGSLAQVQSFCLGCVAKSPISA